MGSKLEKEYCFVAANASPNDVKAWMDASQSIANVILSYSTENYYVEGLGGHTYVTAKVHPGMMLRDFIKWLSVFVPQVENILLLKESTTHELDWSRELA